MRIKTDAITFERPPAKRSMYILYDLLYSLLDFIFKNIYTGRQNIYDKFWLKKLLKSMSNNSRTDED